MAWLLTNLSKAFADDKEAEKMSIDTAPRHGVTVQHLMSFTSTP